MAQKTRPLSDIYVLRIENLNLKMQLLRSQHSLFEAEMQKVLNEAAIQDDTVGWQLDLQQKVWIEPKVKGMQKKKDIVEETPDGNNDKNK